MKQIINQSNEDSFSNPAGPSQATPSAIHATNPAKWLFGITKLTRMTKPVWSSCESSSWWWWHSLNSDHYSPSKTVGKTTYGSMNFLQPFNILATTYFASLRNPLRQAVFTAYSLTFNKIANSLIPHTEGQRKHALRDISIVLREILPLQNYWASPTGSVEILVILSLNIFSLVI